VFSILRGSLCSLLRMTQECCAIGMSVRDKAF
jgi:hypothetical protein